MSGQQKKEGNCEA